MKKILRVAAIATALGLTGITTASPAQALSGNYIRNAVQPSNYKITVSPYTNMTSAVNIWPYQTSAGNVQCFIPELTSHSYWGSVYWGKQKRCFNTPNNGTLTLYSGMP